MIGTTVGKYRIFERLGRGGMGIVYKALDETLDREVAVKVLNPDITDSELLKRFRSEAISLARLNHPGIATIYELHQHGDELLMIMEFVRGETLQVLSERLGPLEPPQAAHICIQILNALSHAHRARIIHRDLKPANVMMTDTGIVKIMDFGIARMLGGEQLTHAGSMMGTPAYMAPEQVLGGEIDGRADLYAVGVLLYRLLSRELPFKADTAIAMAQKQVADAPTPIRSIRPTLPPWCEALIIKALSKAPADRFQTAEEFRAAILTAVTPEALADMPTMVAAAPEIRGGSDMTGTGQGSPPDAPTMTRAVPNTAISTAPSATAGGAPIPGTPGNRPAPGPLTPGSGTVSPVERTGTTVVLERNHLIGLAALLVVLLSGLAALGFAAFRRAPGEATIAMATPSDAGAPAPAPSAPAPPAEPPPTGDTAAVTDPTQAAPVATAPSPAAAPPTSGGGTPGSGTAGRTGANPAARRARLDAAKPTPPATVEAVPASAAPPEDLPAPAAPELAPITFRPVKVLVRQGSKLRERDAVMTLTGSDLAVQSDGTAVASVPFASIVQAFYSRSKEPRWKGPDGQEQSADVDRGRMSFFRGERNWLIVTTSDEPIFVRFEDAQMRTVLPSFEERTGIKVQR